MKRGSRGTVLGFKARQETANARKEATMKRAASLLVLTCIAVPAWSAPPTAEDARACREQAIKAHPTQLAGAAEGSAKAQRIYFQDCMAQRRAKPAKAGQPRNGQAPK
jgi:hypothetical protein